MQQAQASLKCAAFMPTVLHLCRCMQQADLGHSKSLFASMCATYESAGALKKGWTPDSAHDHHNELLPVLLASGHSVERHRVQPGKLVHRIRC